MFGDGDLKRIGKCSVFVKRNTRDAKVFVRERVE
jgi:hypothetical protein